MLRTRQHAATRSGPVAVGKPQTLSSSERNLVRPGDGSRSGLFLDLQRSRGNAYVQRLVQDQLRSRRPELGSPRLHIASPLQRRARKLQHDGHRRPAAINAACGVRGVPESRIRSGDARIYREGPVAEQSPLQKLDADLASSWTFDRTIQADLKALSKDEKQVVLTGTGYRDKLVERLSVDGVRQALATLGADFGIQLDWLKAAGLKLHALKYGDYYRRSTPDGKLDAELERRMLSMCEFLILNQMVTDDISLNWAARSRAEAHVKSTAYHIIRNYVTLADLEELLADPVEKKKETIHTVERGESLSLIAGYPEAGWRERLDQLIAANAELPSLRDRSPADPRYGWLEIGDCIKIPWDEAGDGGGEPAPREVRDADDNVWYLEGWSKAQTDARARQNRGLGKDDKLSLAYEGYEVGDPRRLPNTSDPTHPPVSAHVYGLAIDATIRWADTTKFPSWGPGWSQPEILEHFQLQRPIMENNPYGPAEAEPWHFEKR